MIPRMAADALKIDLSRAEKSNSAGVGGIFATYETKIHLETIHRGTPVDIGMVDVSITEIESEGTD